MSPKPGWKINSKKIIFFNRFVVIVGLKIDFIDLIL